jgi:hypothetical protein
MRIEITLPAKRWQRGRLRAIVDEQEIYSCACLGKTNPFTAAQIGDFPLGQYLATLDEKPMESEKTFGKWPPIRLAPVGGDGLAAKASGRRGFLIHGGHLELDGALRSTSGGGLRVRDTDIDALILLAKKAGAASFPVNITETL